MLHGLKLWVWAITLIFKFLFLHGDNITDVTLAWDDEEPQAHRFILWT